MLGLDLHPGLRFAASLVLLVGGVVTPALAWAGWMRTERALRSGRPLPASLLGPTLAGAATLAGALVLLSVLLR